MVGVPPSLLMFHLVIKHCVSCLIYYIYCNGMMQTVPLVFNRIGGISHMINTKQKGPEDEIVT